MPERKALNVHNTNSNDLNLKSKCYWTYIHNYTELRRGFLLKSIEKCNISLYVKNKRWHILNFEKTHNLMQNADTTEWRSHAQYPKLFEKKMRPSPVKLRVNNILKNTFSSLHFHLLLFIVWPCLWKHIKAEFQFAMTKVNNILKFLAQVPIPRLIPRVDCQLHLSSKILSKTIKLALLFSLKRFKFISVC